MSVIEYSGILLSFGADFLLFGERLEWVKVFGSFLIISSCVYITLS